MIKFADIYKTFSAITPLKTNCGLLCNNACCQGDENTGMTLFPGEEKFFESQPQEWFKIHNSPYRLANGEKLKLLICNGTCPRDQRPLGCRIFPMIPYITEEGFLEIQPDLRAVTMCPLLHTDENIITDEFIDALYDVFEVLIEDERIYEFIELLSKEQNELAEFYA